MFIKLQFMVVHKISKFPIERTCFVINPQGDYNNIIQDDIDMLPFYLRMTSNVLCCNTLRNAECFDSCRTIHTVLAYYTAITEYNNRADIFKLVREQRRLDVRKYFLPEDHPCIYLYIHLRRSRDCLCVSFRRGRPVWVCVIAPLHLLIL